MSDSQNSNKPPVFADGALSAKRRPPRTPNTPQNKHPIGLRLHVCNKDLFNAVLSLQVAGIGSVGIIGVPSRKWQPDWPKNPHYSPSALQAYQAQIPTWRCNMRAQALHAGGGQNQGSFKSVEGGGAPPSDNDKRKRHGPPCGAVLTRSSAPSPPNCKHPGLR